MEDKIAIFWNALGALTFAETLKVAETMRDAVDTVGEFEQSDAADWAFMLNTAREIAEATDEEEAQ